MDKLHINLQPYLKSNANEMTKRFSINQQKDNTKSAQSELLYIEI